MEIHNTRGPFKKTTFTCQNDLDKDLLIEFECIAEYLKNAEKRVSDAQRKMHEEISIASEIKEELSKTKNTWKYKFLSKLRILRK